MATREYCGVVERICTLAEVTSLGLLSTAVKMQTKINLEVAVYLVCMTLL